MSEPIQFSVQQRQNAWEQEYESATRAPTLPAKRNSDLSSLQANGLPMPPECKQPVTMLLFVIPGTEL